MKLKNILIIDDDPDDAEFFRAAVKAVNEAIVVDWVTAGYEAIQFLLKRSASGMPDIVFMDVNMPVMNGWETLREIKRLLASFSLPIVMFSTMSFEDVTVTPSDLGAAAFLTKAGTVDKIEKDLRRLFNTLFSDIVQ